MSYVLTFQFTFIREMWYIVEKSVVSGHFNMCKSEL